MPLDILYIEYPNSLKLFGKNGNWIDIIKNDRNYKAFKKILDSKKYNFINLLA